jgi:hypothetical protein
MHIEDRGLLNVSQFGFRSRHTTTLQCMRHTDHVILNLKNNRSTAAVFLHIEKAIDTTWHPGLPCKLSQLEFFDEFDQAHWLFFFFREENSEFR